MVFRGRYAESLMLARLRRTPCSRMARSESRSVDRPAEKIEGGQVGVKVISSEGKWE